MNWPLVPRAAARNRVQASLARRPFPTALITGPTGIGKTTLARSIAEQVTAEGGRVVEVLGLAELAEVPLGALATALAAQPVGSESGLGERLANAVGAIVALRPSLILVDDAPLLDELSAAAVYQLARVYKLRCLMTARDEHPVVGALQRLDHEGLVERTALEPLTTTEVGTLLEERLGSAVEAESVRSIVARSEGNPLVVRTIALAAQEQQTIRPGAHGLIVEEPRLPRHVGAIVSAQLASLDDDTRHRATVLALAQPVPAEVLGLDVDDLVRAGVATVLDAGTSRIVTIGHPLMTQALLTEAAPAALTRACERAAALLRAAGDEQLRFRGILLAERHDLPVEADELAWAASFAHTVEDHLLAARLAELASAEGARFDAALTRGSALSALGDPAAEQVLQEALSLASTDGQIALGTVRLGHHLAIRAHRPAEAAALGLDRIAVLHEPAGLALIGAELLKWQTMAGMPLTPVALTAPGDGGPGDLAALVGEAMVSSMLGDTARTARATSTARPLVEANRAAMPFADELLDLNDYLVLVFDARIRDAEAFALARHRRPRSDATGLWSYTLGLLYLHSGRAPEALPVAEAAVRELAWRDFTGLQGAAIALRATADAQLGGNEEPELSPSQLSDIKVRLQCAEMVGWRRAAASTPGSAEPVLEAAAEGVAAWHPALAALTAATALRFGQGARVAEMLQSLADSTGSALVGLFARAAAAQASGEATALAAVAAELEASGYVGPAAESWELAARATSDSESARRWRTRVAELSAAHVLTSVLLAPSPRAELSEREWEVARAAAAGRRSQEIAGDLGLSVRTVDNHLGHIYRKVGVRNRTQLAAALDEFSE